MIIPIKPWLDLANGAGNSPVSGFRGLSGSGVILSSCAETDELRLHSRGGGLTSVLDFTNQRMEFYHEPILAQEVLDAMEPVAGKQIFDGTLGGGGHSELLLKHGAHIIGCDQDQDALDYAQKRLAGFEDAFLPVRGNFRDIDQILEGLGIGSVNGILLDLGVSSRQLDNPERGFSFREDGPLDMRMDTRSGLSAAQLVNEWSEAELIRIFREYGEESRAARVAREIVKARALKPISTTFELSEVVGRAIPKTSAKNPATKVFQAIRIAVNGELSALEDILEKSVSVLEAGGVLVIITFHSLEDRIVKRFMHRRSSPFIDRPEWPEPRANPDFCFHLPSRRSIAPDEAETRRNSRSRSARLRVAVRV
jgi:16S rRNA (cytosine1402-N4)-methyltransferase